MLNYHNDSKKLVISLVDLDTSIGVVQPEGGPCGVLAAIQSNTGFLYFFDVNVN